MILWSASVKVRALQVCVLSTYWICGFLQLCVLLLCIFLCRCTVLFFPYNIQLFLIIVLKLSVYNTFLVLVSLRLSTVHSAKFMGNLSQIFFCLSTIEYPWFLSIWLWNDSPHWKGEMCSTCKLSGCHRCIALCNCFCKSQAMYLANSEVLMC